MDKAPGSRGVGSPSALCLSGESWSELAGRLKLSPRRLAITRLIFDGRTEPAIAAELAISESTVHTHLDRLYKKLGVHGRCELVVAVFRAYVASSHLDGRVG